MITIAPTLFSLPPNDNTVPGADQTTDPAKNFFPLLLALFPAGMTHSQLSQSTSVSESFPSTRLSQSQAATQSASFVDASGEKTARQTMGAAAGKGDGTIDNTLSNPNLLLSLLLPFVSGQMPPTNPVQIAQVATQEGQDSSQSIQDIAPPNILTQSRSTQGAMNETVGVDPGKEQVAVSGAPPSLGREGQDQAVGASFISLSDDQSPLVFAKQSVSTLGAESTGVNPSDAKPRAVFPQSAVATTLKNTPVERGVDEQSFTRSAKSTEQTGFLPTSMKNENQAGGRPEIQSLGAPDKGGLQAGVLEEGDTLGQPALPRATTRPAPTGVTTYIETKANLLTGEAPSLSQPRATTQPTPIGVTTPVETKANLLAKGTLNPYDSEERKESVTYSGQTPIVLQKPQAEALDYTAQIPMPGLELGVSLGRMSQARLFRQGQIGEAPVEERNQTTEPDVRSTTLRSLPFPEQEPQALSAAVKDPFPHVEVETIGTIAPATSGGQTKGKEKLEAALRSAHFLTAEPLASPTPRQGNISVAGAESLIVNDPTGRANLSGEEGKTLTAPRLALFPTPKGQDVPVTPQETTPISAKPTDAGAEFVLSESNSTASPATERLLGEGLARGKGSSSFLNGQKSVVEADSLTMKNAGIPSLSVSQLQPERPLGPRNNLEAWQPVVNQVAERIATNVREESREARLQLEPPELGKLDIQLVVEGSHIRAHIVAGSADVGALIQTHLPELKHALQDHRLNLDSVRVDVQGDDGGRDPSSRNFQQDRRASGRGSNLGSSATAVEEKESLPVLSPVHARGRVSVWA